MVEERSHHGIVYRFVVRPRLTAGSQTSGIDVQVFLRNSIIALQQVDVFTTILWLLVPLVCDVLSYDCAVLPSGDYTDILGKAVQARRAAYQAGLCVCCQRQTLRGANVTGSRSYRLLSRPEGILDYRIFRSKPSLSVYTVSVLASWRVINAD
jgi:hypothetical protein